MGIAKPQEYGIEAMRKSGVGNKRETKFGDDPFGRAESVQADAPFGLFDRLWPSS